MTRSAWGKAGFVHMDAGSARSQDQTSRERGCSARLGWRRPPPQSARGDSWRLLAAVALGDRRLRCNSDRDEERRPRRRWSSPSFGAPRHRDHASTSSIPPPLQCVDLARYFTGHTYNPDGTIQYVKGKMAVPEGLPLAVTLTLAFSTRKMMKDKALVLSAAADVTSLIVEGIAQNTSGSILSLSRVVKNQRWLDHIQKRLYLLDDRQCFDIF